MRPDPARGAPLSAQQVEAIRKRLEAAFLPHRCFVNVSDDQFLDFEVMTLMGDPVVAFTSSPIEIIAEPADLDDLLFEAKQLGAERGHAFDQPARRL
jgi:hypothetical protein